MLRGAPTAISQSIAEGLRSCEQSTSFPKRVEQPPCNRCRTDPFKELERQVCVPEPETQIRVSTTNLIQSAISI